MRQRASRDCTLSWSCPAMLLRSPVSCFASANETSAEISRLVKRFSRWTTGRSEEHTSELQSLRHLVCRLLLEKKKKPKKHTQTQKKKKKKSKQINSTKIK